MRHFLVKLKFCSISFLMFAISCALHAMPVRIGIYAPFSNDHAFVGRGLLGAMELARDEMRLSEMDYSFYTLDEISNTEHAARVLKKFVKAYDLQVLVSDGATDGAIAAKVAKQMDLIHINLSAESGIADGKNTFQVLKSAKKQSPAQMNAGFIKAYQAQYINPPSVEAGYAYDMFHLLHKSVHASIAHRKGLSTQQIAHELYAMKAEQGVMGRVGFSDKQVG